MAKYHENIFLQEVKQMVVLLVFLSRVGRDWWQEDYRSNTRWSQDRQELWTVKVRLLPNPKNVRYAPVHSKLDTPGIRIWKLSFEEISSMWVSPKGKPRGTEMWKKRVWQFPWYNLWKWRSALRNIPSIGWGSHKRGDVRRNHAWLNTKSTQRNEI